jgi:hypothetical protein
MNCMPCTQRLYSCKGLPDGDNGIPGHRWSDQYVTCYRNRTITIHKCTTGMFDPINKVCDNKIDKGMERVAKLIFSIHITLFTGVYFVSLIGGLL